MDEADDIDNGSVHSNLVPKGALNGLQDGGKMDAYDTTSNVDHLNTSSNDGNSKGLGSLQENTKMIWNDLYRRSKRYAFSKKKLEEELKSVDSGCNIIFVPSFLVYMS